jgi:hypothetical protein
MSAFGTKAERRNIATDGLNGENIPTARGGAWSATQVMQVAETLDRLAVRLISLNVPQTAFAAGVAMESGNTGTVCCASG